MTTIAKRPKVFGAGLIALDLVIGADPRIIRPILGRWNLRQCYRDFGISRMESISNRPDEWRSSVRSRENRPSAVGCRARLHGLHPDQPYADYHPADPPSPRRLSNSSVPVVLPALRPTVARLQGCDARRCSNSGPKALGDGRILHGSAVAGCPDPRGSGFRGRGCRRFRALGQIGREALRRGDTTRAHCQILGSTPRSRWRHDASRQRHSRRGANPRRRGSAVPAPPRKRHLGLVSSRCDRRSTFGGHLRIRRLVHRRTGHEGCSRGTNRSTNRRSRGDPPCSKIWAGPRRVELRVRGCARRDVRH